MPTEVRRLLFDDDELCKVLTTSVQEQNDGAEPGTVIAVEIVNRDPINVHATIHTRDGRQVSKSYDAAFLCSALVAWCMDQKIPIARKARKAARITSDGVVALDLTVAGAVLPKVKTGGAEENAGGLRENNVMKHTPSGEGQE